MYERLVLALDGSTGVCSAALLRLREPRAVLGDKRLAGMELELVGHFKNPGTFTVNPIHTKAMFVLKDSKKLFITYWCDVCSIRTHSPGRCWCCQEETNLDLRESLEP